MNTKFKLGLRKIKLPKQEYDTKEKVLHDKTDFVTVETYKSIRTKIMFSIPKTEHGKVITITSSTPGEGKTTASINLAITFAQMGAKVLLIDCDLRKARVHRYLGLSLKDGVSNVLCGFAELSSTIKKNVRENLDVLTCGEIPPNPAELLETEAFESMLNTLKKEYDYIFIDTPPITVVTDASILMRHSTGVVVIVRENVTTFDLLDITISDIQKTNATILGVVMVGCENAGGVYSYKKKKYKRYYRYGYRYKYKYDYRYQYDPKNPEDETDSQAE